MKKSERMLLGLFVSLLALVVLAGGGVYALRQYLNLRAEIDLLRDRLGAMNLAVSQGANWADRYFWLDEHAPTFTSGKEASARLLETVMETARNHGLTVGATEFIEALGERDADGLPVAAEESAFQKVAIKTVFTSVSEKAFFGWLHELQTPSSFLGITRLQLNPSGTDKTIHAEIEFTQFFREKAVPKVTKSN